MDKKYTSLESTIRNVVRGNTGAAQDNRSLESKIRSVVLKEEKVARNNVGDRVEINMPGAAAHGQSGILKSVDEDGMARVHLNPNMGATGTQTKMGSGDQTISGLNVRMGGTHTYVPLSRLKLFYPDNLDEEVGLEEARRKSAASLGFISTNAGHGVTASSEPYGYSHLPVVTTSSGNRVDVGHNPYPTPELAQQGAEEFIKNTYTRQGTDPVRGFKALAKHHSENAKKKTNEEVSINEAPDDAAPPGENHLSVHELFGYLRDYNEDHDRSTDPEDPDEYGAKESRADINSTEKMIRKIHGQDTLDHVRNAIESERHIRLGTNPGVNNHQAVKDHLDAAVRASRHFSEALGTGGNEGGEFKGIPPAFFKPFHVEPKVGDAHPPSEGAAAASRNRAKIASSETMKKEGYVITPSGRKPLINEAELEEGSEKFAKIMARTAAKRGEPITTDTTELEKKHAELLQAHQDALAHADQTKKDYEDLLRKYGSVQEDSLQEFSLKLPPGLANIKIPPALTNLFRGSGKSPGKPSPKAPTPGKGKPANKPSGSGAGVGSGISKLGAAAGIVSAAADLLGGGGAAAATKTSGSGDGAGAGGDISNLTVNRHYTKGRVYHGPEIHYNEYEPDGDYIGEDSAEKADAERSAIENVARPNSKNKLTKNAELNRKIIEDTQRRKGVIKGILRAKEENKNGKDGANSGVETKPELKRVDVNEITASELATGTRKVAGKVGRVITGPVGTIAGTAIDAKTAYDAGEDPERIALRTGLGAAGGIAGGVLGAAAGTAVPGPGNIIGGAAGAYGGSELGDYVGSKLYDTGIYGKGKAFAKGAADTVSDAADAVSDTASSAYNKLKGAFSSPTPAPTPKPTTNTGSVGGAAAGRAITQSSKPGSVGGTTAGKAITKVAPKPAPKPALKLPGPGTPGYRTDAQMAQAEADRARLLNANPNSVGARSAGNRSVEAATKSLNTNTPAVAPQTSPGINSTNTETPRSMGSSWNNSYKNKYSMGPGPSQFPSK